MKRLLERLRAGLPAAIAQTEGRSPELHSARTAWLQTLPETIQLPAHLDRCLNDLWRESLRQGTELGRPLRTGWRGDLRPGKILPGHADYVPVGELRDCRDVYGFLHTHELGNEGVALSPADLHKIAAYPWLLMGVQSGSARFLAGRPENLVWNDAETRDLLVEGTRITLACLDTEARRDGSYAQAILETSREICFRWNFVLYGSLGGPAAARFSRNRSCGTPQGD